jgi:hypothetical protein
VHAPSLAWRSDICEEVDGRFGLRVNGRPLAVSAGVHPIGAVSRSSTSARSSVRISASMAPSALSSAETPGRIALLVRGEPLVPAIDAAT